MTPRATDDPKQPRTTPYRDADEALRDVEHGWQSRASRHWPDLLLPVAALILVVRFGVVAVDAWQRKPEPPAPPESRYALSLQLTPGSVRAGTTATLLLSPAVPGATAPGLVIDRVPVLASTETQVVVAVTRAQLDSLAPRLGTSRVYLSTTVTR